MLGRVKLTYKESGSYAANPYQGMYIQVDSANTEAIETASEKGVNLILLAVNLNGFYTGGISAEKLSEIRAAFETAEKHGLQIIFRAAYGFSKGMGTREPKSFDVTEAHMGQLAEILNDNKNLLVSVQSGMLGPWGEGNNSIFFTTANIEKNIRNKTALLWHELLSEDIQLQLRTPQCIRFAAEAGVPLRRMGMHNDALLSSCDDLGTYENRGTEIEWLKKELSHSKTGGETAVRTELSKAENAVSEFKQLGLCYLNMLYNTDVLQLWKNEVRGADNAYDYIRNHLGMRIHLSRASLPSRISKVQNRVKVILKNTGFFESMKSLEFKLVLKTESGIKYLEPDAIEMRKDEAELRARLAELPQNGPFELGVCGGHRSAVEKPWCFANEREYQTEYGVKIAGYTNGRIRI